VTETIQNDPSVQQAILHICKREMLRPLRDQILRLSGYHVDSTCVVGEGLSMFSVRPYALVLIDVEGEYGVAEAEKLCGDLRAAHHGQIIAFVCNWRVAINSSCPNDIVRTEFDPAAFAAGVEDVLRKN
jgi:DNA-binding response OmpR family regulator